jgi:hypothetical protein
MPTNTPVSSEELPTNMILEATPENLALISSRITRKCGECTACCFTFANQELDKPQSCWCPKVAKKAGCSIYPDRPKECKWFFCDWLQGNYDEKDRPDKVGIVIDAEPNANLMLCSVFNFEPQTGFPMLRCTQLRPNSAWQPRAREILLRRSFDWPITVRGFRNDPDVDLMYHGKTYHLKHLEFSPKPAEWICWCEEPMATQLWETMKSMSPEELKEKLAGHVTTDEEGRRKAVAMEFPGKLRLVD